MDVCKFHVGIFAYIDTIAVNGNTAIYQVNSLCLSTRIL